MTNELMPCPFCGSSATANDTCIEPNWWVTSINCDGIHDHICAAQMIAGGDTRELAHEGAVEAWNRRAL